MTEIYLIAFRWSVCRINFSSTMTNFYFSWVLAFSFSTSWSIIRLSVLAISAAIRFCDLRTLILCLSTTF